MPLVTCNSGHCKYWVTKPSDLDSASKALRLNLIGSNSPLMYHFLRCDGIICTGSGITRAGSTILSH